MSVQLCQWQIFTSIVPSAQSIVISSLPYSFPILQLFSTKLCIDQFVVYLSDFQCITIASILFKQNRLHQLHIFHLKYEHFYQGRLSSKFDTIYLGVKPCCLHNFSLNSMP